MKVAVIFDRFGPYHVARIKSACNYLTVVPIELFGESVEYNWEKVRDLSERFTLFKGKAARQVSGKVLFSHLYALLSKLQPDVVAVNGWSDRGALAALYWCKMNHIPAILMSESSFIDEHRKSWKEFIKRRIVRLYAAALVGGSRHIHYLQVLGFPADKVFLGYDVIDNEYFRNRVYQIRSEVERANLQLPQKYFLASCRFIKKKNLPLLIRAFASYRKQSTTEPYDLVIMGDGEEKDKLTVQIKVLKLQQAVHLTGFVQYSILPLYYAFASVFIHASSSEQWGLVVNEAMAAGLPVIVSDRCGCVPELVKDRINGLLFNPFDEGSLTSRMLQITSPQYNIKAMGYKSAQTIGLWEVSQFGVGLQQAVRTALEAPIKPFSAVDKLVLKSLIYR